MKVRVRVLFSLTAFLHRMGCGQHLNLDMDMDGLLVDSEVHVIHISRVIIFRDINNFHVSIIIYM